MTYRTPSTRIAMAALALALPTATMGAQGGGSGFSFREPRVALTIRGGYGTATGRSDLFDLATDTLTLGRGDFAGLALAADVAISRPGSRLDIVAGSGMTSSSAPSEFRNWTDTDDRPIEQTTSFRRIPLTVGAKAYLVPRGRAIGRFAWVPAKLAPYVGAGVGATWYRFRQSGDFMDYATREIFTDDLESSGWGATGYAGAGLDVALGPHVALTTDARYTYAKASVGGDFEGFDRIDLSGFATTLGFTFRF
jgi:hypothetical protein